MLRIQNIKKYSICKYETHSTTQVEQCLGHVRGLWLQVREKKTVTKKIEI